MKNLYKLKIELFCNIFFLIFLSNSCTQQNQLNYANKIKKNSVEHEDVKNPLTKELEENEDESENFVFIEKTPSPSFSMSSNNDTKDGIINRSLKDEIEYNTEAKLKEDVVVKAKDEIEKKTRSEIDNKIKNEIENTLKDKIKDKTKDEVHSMKSKDNLKKKLTKTKSNNIVMQKIVENNEINNNNNNNSKIDINLNTEQDEKIISKISYDITKLTKKVHNNKNFYNVYDANNLYEFYNYDNKLYNFLINKCIILNKKFNTEKKGNYNNYLPTNIEFYSTDIVAIDQKKLYEDFQRIFENCTCKDKSKIFVLKYLLKFSNFNKHDKIDDNSKKQVILPFTNFIGDLHNLSKPNWLNDHKLKFQLFSYSDLTICIEYFLDNNQWHYENSYIQCEKCKMYNVKKGSIFPEFASGIFRKFNAKSEHNFRKKFKKLYKIAKPFNFNVNYKFHFLEDFRYNKNIIKDYERTFENKILNLLSNKNNIYVILPYYQKNTGETNFFYIFLKENNKKYIILNLYKEEKKYLIKDVLDFNSKYIIEAVGKASTYLVIHGTNFYSVTK